MAAGAALIVALGARASAAQSLSVDAVTPRAVARAGTGTVSDDLGGAWAHNPASAARRSSTRALAGVTVVDTDLQLSAFSREPAPDQVSRAGMGRAPLAALALSWGETTLGLSVLSAQRVARRFEGPPSDLALDDIQRAFGLRYAGLSGALRRELVMLGAARRFGDDLALGLSVGAARVALRESRHLWAGIPPRDQPGDPRRDLVVLTSASDLAVPMLSAGAVYVPGGGPVELALAATYVAASDLEGVGYGVAADLRSPRLVGGTNARLHLPHALVVRSGVRWQGQRLSVEGNGQLELWPASAAALSWQLEAQVEDSTGERVGLPALASQLSLRSTGALRAAADYELVDGLLWLVGGVSWTPLGTSAERLTPGFGELGGVTFGAGVEVSAGGVTASFGLSRQWSAPRSVRSSLRDTGAPFGGAESTGFARYESGVELVGFSLEIERM